MASQQLATFGGQRHCDSGDIMILVCHVISQDHVIKGSYDFFWQEPIKVRYPPAKIDGHRHSDSGDIVVLVCHVISQSHAIKE